MSMKYYHIYYFNTILNIKNTRLCMHLTCMCICDRKQEQTFVYLLHGNKSSTACSSWHSALFRPPADCGWISPTFRIYGDRRQPILPANLPFQPSHRIATKSQRSLPFLPLIIPQCLRTSCAPLRSYRRGLPLTINLIRFFTKAQWLSQWQHVVETLETCLPS